MSGKWVSAFALAALAGGCVTADSPPVDSLVEDCTGWCKKSSLCSSQTEGGGQGAESCVYDCRYSHDVVAVEYGAACQDAFAEAMACLATIGCADYLKVGNLPTDEGPCPDVVERYYDLCPGVFIAPGELPMPTGDGS